MPHFVTTNDAEHFAVIMSQQTAAYTVTRCDFLLQRMQEGALLVSIHNTLDAACNAAHKITLQRVEKFGTIFVVKGVLSIRRGRDYVPLRELALEDVATKQAA